MVMKANITITVSDMAIIQMGLMVSITHIHICMLDTHAYIYVYIRMYVTVYIYIYRVDFRCISGGEQRIGAFFLSVSELTLCAFACETKGKHREEWKTAMDLILWIN